MKDTTMREREESADDDVDRELRRHLSGALDPHVGRAERAFAAYRGGERARRSRWFVGTAAIGSVAALVAVSWAIVAHRPRAGGGGRVVVSSTQPREVAAPVAEPVERSVSYVTTDEGTVVLDGLGPARQLRRTVLETYQYYDAERNGQIEITVPREQTVLVGMRTY